MFVDSHCHLDFEDMKDDLDGMLSRARAAGVGIFHTIGISQPDFPKVRAIAEAQPDVYFSLAVHPHEAEKPGEEVTVDQLVALTQHPKAIGIGETGLDYFYDHSPREAQQRNFRTHIRACIASRMPLIIHTRDAEDDTIQILREERAGHEDELTGVLHCFSSERRMADYGLEIGFYISFSGMITFNKSQNIREIARDIPVDRLLIETDAPFLAPIPYRGKACEPAYVIETAKKLAEIKGVSLGEIEAATTANFLKLFPKVGRGGGAP
ncbi:MAG: TatD family hydrolase [Alphaproteobacteria bacterium]|jgi:TatD DNase family protein|nr:TatD family hydrolase [Alphaproteobacteria bacterium]